MIHLSMWRCAECKKEFSEKEILDHRRKKSDEILKKGRGFIDNPCGCFIPHGEKFIKS